MTADERKKYFAEKVRQAQRLAKQMEMTHIIEMEMEKEIDASREMELIDRYYRQHAEA